MTTRTVERQRTKCGQYWPDDVNGDPLHVAFSPFVVNLLSEEKVRIGNGIIRQFPELFLWFIFTIVEPEKWEGQNGQPKE